LTLANDWPLPLLGVDCYVVVVPPDRTPESVVQALSRDARVAWAQTMNVYRAQGHNDPLYALQPAAQAWHLSELHAFATGRGVRVAIVDSGIDDHHPDLAGQVERKENFVDGRRDVPEQHGTAVAGIIGARADNGVGIVGVAPSARLFALRACWEERSRATLCNSLSLAMALHFAIEHEAEIINLSLSGPPDRLLDRLIDAALARGMAVVAAVDPDQPDGGFPASHAGVVAVTNSADIKTPNRALIAPGRDVPTTLPDGHWSLVSGPSYSAAHVSGLLALMREHTADRAGPPSVSSVVSFPGGEIDACATLTRVPGDGACVRAMTHPNSSLVRR
jgi:subtilisin family serine protease